MGREKIYIAESNGICKEGDEHRVVVVGIRRNRRVAPWLNTTCFEFNGDTETIENREMEEAAKSAVKELLGVKKTRRQSYRVKDFTVGWAICNPDDDFDYDDAIKLAKKRADFAMGATANECFFSGDVCYAIVREKARNIAENIDKYIEKYKKEHRKR